METTLKDAERRSAAAATKAERARDGAQAMKEYEAERLALQAKTARLRALRLANEAGDATAGAQANAQAAAPETPETKKKKLPAKKKAVRRVATATRTSGQPRTLS
jgi:hypothetical protein